MTFDRYSELYSELLHLFKEEETPLVYGAVEGFHVAALDEIRSHDHLSHDHFAILDIFFDWAIEPIDGLDEDTLNAIGSVGSLMREESHGAVTLDKVYLSESLYNKIVKDAGVEENKNYKIKGALLLKSDLLKDKRCVFLGKSKFQVVPVQHLVILGNWAV